MPPKKKKSGKKNLANMTEEERLIYLEQKRLAEEEMRKKKEEMLTQFLKDKLAKEEKNSKFNMNKLQNQWRVILRESKAQVLRKDIEILSQTFERIIDRKEAITKSLVKDIEEAEEQYEMALRSHLQNEDCLINLHQSRLKTLSAEFKKEQEMIRKEFDNERSQIIGQHKQEVTDIQDIIFAMEQENQEQENEMKQEFQSYRDEIKNKNLEEKHALRIQLEGTVEDLWRQFQQALKNYNETTEERKNAFENLKQRDEKSAKEIETQMRKLQRIQDNISQLKVKLASNSKECDERNRVIKEQREVIAAEFHELKAEMNKYRETERCALTQLTLQSNGSIKELQRQKGKGAKILRLAEMCRKLETEQEKVLPFYSSTLTEEEEEQVKSAEQEEPAEVLAKVLHEYTSLENFWKRYNKIVLDKLALDKEKFDLLRENKQLRAVLKQYLDGISVNDEILTQQNPLFVVNNKTNVSFSVPVNETRIRRAVPATVVEAAHVVKNTI